MIASPEGALQAFNHEALDLDHATFARECAIDIPGPEANALGREVNERQVALVEERGVWVAPDSSG